MSLGRQYLILILVISALTPTVARCQDPALSFAEEFAMSEQRGKLLERLIPGTEDFYFYSCLERQHAGALAEVPALLDTWIKRHGRTHRVVEIENRQALLLYSKDPAATFKFLRERLELRFDQEPQRSGVNPDLPTQLDPALIAYDVLAKRARDMHRGTLDGFRDTALPAFVARGIADDLLPKLLDRLDRPDLPGLPALVVRDLERPKSSAFGSRRIHAMLLLDQLEECARQRPSLLQEMAFIKEMVKRLGPNADVTVERDDAEHAAWLDRLEAFARRLPASHNSFKASVLFRRLAFDRNRGRYEKERFLEYLRLPRRADWVHADYVRKTTASENFVDNDRDYGDSLGKIGNDLPLVRDYLEHFFATEDTVDAYATYVKKEYLDRVLAETKILAGAPDKERWYSLLNDPAYYEQLKERVEIAFAPTSTTYYSVEAPVKLDLDIKNVANLLVKVYEINALNYYVDAGKDVDASIKLDGLVAGDEKTYTYDASPFVRVRRSFEFPALSRPGVWVIDFIGNGLSSRAVVKKGRLAYTERYGSAGHVFRVRDESGKHLANASIRLGNREYVADEHGEVLIPYSTQPGPVSIILKHGDLVTLDSFQHASENYRLLAGYHVDRESLLAGNVAKILVRTDLRVNGEPASLQILEDPILDVRSENLQGVSSSVQETKLVYTSGKEAVFEIRVPDDLRRLHVGVRGRVKRLSTAEMIDLAGATSTFELNRQSESATTSSAYLGRADKGWFIDVLGRNGEAFADVAVNIALTFRDFTDVMPLVLRSGREGRIELGALSGVERIRIDGVPFGNGEFALDDDARTYARQMRVAAGSTVRVPYVGTKRENSRDVVSFIEMRAGAPVRDAIAETALVDGFIEIRNAKPGSYELRLVESGERIQVMVASGEVKDGWIHGRHRLAERSPEKSFHVTKAESNGEDIVIHCVGAGSASRVHVFGSNYAPAYDAMASLVIDGRGGLGEESLVGAESIYESGRAIGDEFRYILDRRLAKKYPGNMLRRPEILLNPWSLSTTNAAIGLGGGAGGAFGGRRGGRSQARRGRGAAGAGRSESAGEWGVMDFLATPGVVLANLRPDEAGIVKIPRSKLGGAAYVRIVAIDGDDVIERQVFQPAAAIARRDQRLARSLDVTKDYSEQKSVEFANAGAAVTVEDRVASTVQVYDSLERIFALFRTFGGGRQLHEFAFLLGWPKLDRAAKEAAYSEHACHEVNFFIYQKDREFFDAVVRPYLMNKRDKTFLDEWLLDLPLERHLAPRAFAELNVFERILLLRKTPERLSGGRRHIIDMNDAIVRDANRSDIHIVTATLGESLKKLDDAAGLFKAPRDEKEMSKKPNAPAKNPAEAAEPELVEEEVVDADDQEVVEDSVKDKSVERLAESGVSLQDFDRRKSVEQLWRDPGSTNRFAEHNYFQRLIGEQTASLIGPDRFWRDFAVADPSQPFHSVNFLDATDHATEMILALAVLDLPFTSAEHDVAIDGPKMTINAKSPLMLVRREIREAVKAKDDEPLSLSEAFFRLDDRFVQEGNERREKFVSDEFQMGVAYGCRIVVTNPSSRTRDFELLLQVPAGAMPLSKGAATQSTRMSVAAYGMQTAEYHFYFPSPGTFSHYPARAAKDGEVLAAAAAEMMKVVPVLSTVDTTSWNHVSQNGSTEEVLAYLDGNNIERLDLSRIAWRMKSKDVYDAVLAKLRSRFAWSDALWSFSILHGDADAGREFIERKDSFVGRCGAWLDTPLLSIDPVLRRTYEHIEFSPLYNARTGRFANRREIRNTDLAAQYGRLLTILAYRPKLDDSDLLSLTYYLLLQDRVEEALETFTRIDPRGVTAAVQYDYMKAYLEFFGDNPATARTIAERYLAYPVPRWRQLFQDVVAHLDEAEGKTVSPIDSDDRANAMGIAAAKEPTLELKVEGGKVKVQSMGFERCELAYYVMDVEFLFSNSPFVQNDAGAFTYVKPNLSSSLTCEKSGSTFDLPVPAELGNANLLVEARAGGLVRRQTWFSNSLDVRMIENFGQCKVTDVATKKPLSRVYVKVFARRNDGSVHFYKDGYTDLRGRFDYASLSGPEAVGVNRFAILVQSEEKGAVIREVTPPTR